MDRNISSLIFESSFFTKKAISPVVATALLLVVAVVAAVGFQTWYNQYSSGMFVDIEGKSSQSITGTGIETIVGDSLYIKNGNGGNLSIISVKIDGIECSGLNGSYTPGMKDLNVSSCIGSITTLVPDVVVVTDTGIFSKKIYLKDDNVINSGTSLDCSSLNGGDWIKVPANPSLGVNNDFCVMKYEAKFVNGTGKTVSLGTDTWNGAPGDKNITSTSTGNPIGTINQTDAMQACSNLGTGYQLISDEQWVTIARNAEQVDANWNTSTKYSGYMMRGHSDGSTQVLEVSNVNDPYDGTGNSWPSIERRTLNISNGEVIWDIGGNIWEWNSNTFPTSGAQNSSLGLGDGWKEWNLVSSSTYPNLVPNNTTLTSTNGIGQVYVDSGIASDGGDIHAFLRGGSWFFGASAGPFALYLNIGPSYSDFDIGFRCSYAE